jgi:hypothetical protein
MNASSRRESQISGRTGERFGETNYRQTPEEHRALLDRYKGVKGIPPDVAAALGEEEEKLSPRYWDTDSEPRYGGSTPSSSFVTAMNVSPGLNLCTFTMKNGRSYSYALDPDRAGDILNSNSIGAAYNKMVKLGHSNIPVNVTPRSGARLGPAPMVLTGTRGGLAAAGSPSGTSYRPTTALPTGSLTMLGLQGLGTILKAIKNSK